mmetsp:Transcript_16647/g.24612  ORF Transcript_16647/g.24612 Transcript_16647/m.24612 type:complete len:95 (+) Transcript_16647:184-468(+)
MAQQRKLISLLQACINTPPKPNKIHTILKRSEEAEPHKLKEESIPLKETAFEQATASRVARAAVANNVELLDNETAALPPKRTRITPMLSSFKS